MFNHINGLSKMFRTKLQNEKENSIQRKGKKKKYKIKEIEEIQHRRLEKTVRRRYDFKHTIYSTAYGTRRFNAAFATAL